MRPIRLKIIAKLKIDRNCRYKDIYLFEANGFQSLYTNTTGTANTAIGTSALYLNNTGWENTAVGYNALNINTSGSDNTACGLNALLYNTSGSNNTGLGRNALLNNSGGTGTYNTAVGMGSDVSGSGLTNATAIGANATVSASNALVLGNGANVGIGTTAPAAKLQVTSGIRLGSETGTYESPIYPDGTGLVVRRARSTSSTAGNAAAVTDYLRLERDGTSGGWRINNNGAVPYLSCHCTGVTNTGAVIGKALTPPIGISTVFTDAENVVFIHCLFGNFYAGGHTTEVSLSRTAGDFWWYGTLNSTYNQ